MQVLKQRVSRAMRRRKRVVPGQLRLWEDSPLLRYRSFWQRRFYDFNVWSSKKRNEKLNYMHFNPVNRGLVAHPKDWLWSSYGFYRPGNQINVRLTRNGYTVRPFNPGRVGHPRGSMN